MNICLIDHYAGSTWHGMEYRPFYLGKEWAQEGHHVTIVAGSYSHLRTETPLIAEGANREEIAGIHYVWLKTPSYQGNGYRRLLNIFSFVRQLFRYNHLLVQKNQPDVVIASSTHPLDIYPARFLARRTGAKLIFEVHDLWPLSLTELAGMSRWHPFILLTQCAENYAYRHADLVVSMLPNAESHMRDHGLAAGKFAHVPNGVDLSEWQTPNEGLALKYKETVEGLKRNGRFLVGYAGGHGLANALDSLIQAARLLRGLPVTFLLVGKGPDKQRLQKIVQDYGLNNVIFWPILPKSAMPGLLKLMDVLYLGYKQKPLYRFGVNPNKLMDYMMAARPVIYGIDSANDLVSESGCGISIPPEDPDAIAKAVKDLMGRGSAQRDALGLKGKEYIIAHHDYRVLALRFLDLMRVCRSQ